MEKIPKKKIGRPRIHPITEKQPRKYVYKKKELTRQQAAELYKGVTLIQIDYFTGEYVGEYPSISACSQDLDIPISTLLNSFSRGSKGSCIARIQKYETLLIRKEAFDALMESVPNDYQL